MAVGRPSAVPAVSVDRKIADKEQLKPKIRDRQIQLAVFILKDAKMHELIKHVPHHRFLIIAGLDPDHRQNARAHSIYKNAIRFQRYGFYPLQYDSHPS